MLYLPGMDHFIGKDIQASHDRIASQYGILPGEGDRIRSYNSWNIDRNVRQILRQITHDCCLSEMLLDAGCGNGQIAQLYLENGIRKILGIDFSINMLKTAGLRFKKSGIPDRFQAVLMDLNDLGSIKNGALTAASIFGVIEHLDYPDAVLMELYRIIQPGGFLIVGVPRKWSLSFLSYILFGQSPKEWGFPRKIQSNFKFREKLKYYRFFTPGEIYGLISQLQHASVVNRIPFGWSHMDGLPGFLLHWLGRNQVSGYRWLDAINCFFRKIGCRPAGEYWIVRKGIAPCTGKN